MTLADAYDRLRVAILAYKRASRRRALADTQAERDRYDDALHEASDHLTAAQAQLEETIRLSERGAA